MTWAPGSLTPSSGLQVCLYTPGGGVGGDGVMKWNFWFFKSLKVKYNYVGLSPCPFHSTSYVLSSYSISRIYGLSLCEHVCMNKIKHFFFKTSCLDGFWIGDLLNKLAWFLPDHTMVWWAAGLAKTRHWFLAPSRLLGTGHVTPLGLSPCLTAA